MFDPYFSKSKSEKAENLDLEVLNAALSFGLEKYKNGIFREYEYVWRNHELSLKYLLLSSNHEQYLFSFRHFGFSITDLSKCETHCISNNTSYLTWIE